ncbi:tyrosine-type recombinase/integrase [Pseudonocardia phyllosphaerae]|uniref:tyrosine-type recombinase/integrase n=1 Tax=Pseudonocardia phyllosphaerae TaxID=3390502 RepID=UPI00397CF85A
MPTPLDSSDLRTLLVSWNTSLKAERKSPETIRSYAFGVERFLRWCEERDLSPDLTRSRVRTWTEDLLSDGVSAATARTRQLAIRRFSAWLAEEDEIPTDELVGIKPIKLDQKITPALTDDEVSALVRACRGTRMQDYRDTALVRLMVDTGIRAGECANLRLSDVRIPDETVIVRGGKGGKDRVMYLPAETQRALDRYLRKGRRGHVREGSDALWVGERGKTFSYDSLHKTLRKRADAAGLVDFHPHVLRHTFATNWLTDGGSEGSLMALAGWTRREMLDRYTRSTASARAMDEARRLRDG